MILEAIFAVAEDDQHLQIVDVRNVKSMNVDSDNLSRNLIPDDFISSDTDKKDFVCSLRGLYIPNIEEVDFGKCTCRGYIKVDDNVKLSSLINKII